MPSIFNCREPRRLDDVGAREQAAGGQHFPYGANWRQFVCNGKFLFDCVFKKKRTSLSSFTN